MTLATLPWQQAWANLPSDFYTIVAPTPLPNPYWIAGNAKLAAELGIKLGISLDDSSYSLSTPNNVAILAGSQPLNTVPSIATVYSGHQFGVWAGQLGDGRALLLGELAGQEWQLKGAGKTPYSRTADGRAVLRSSIREFLCSEAMAGLGIPTTRALALVGADYPVFRETTETAAVVTRIAPSFTRFGHFEHFSARQQIALLRELADHTINRYFPEIAALPAAERDCAWLAEIVQRTANLVAAWQSVGFCHGVMNTDNMSILGLTIDYGPFGFLDSFDWQHICNHSDSQGRYAYHAQPDIAYWNVYALGQALLPLFEAHGLGVIEVKALLDKFPNQFSQTMQARWRAKLGLLETHADDEKLVMDLLNSLHENQVDFTRFFRRLCHYDPTDPNTVSEVRDLFIDRAAADAWLQRYQARCALEAATLPERQQAMRQVNPKYVLRNYLAEQAIQQAQQGNYEEIHRLLLVLQQPYDEHEVHSVYAQLPPSWASTLSVSCSS